MFLNDTLFNKNVSMLDQIYFILFEKDFFQKINDIMNEKNIVKQYEVIKPEIDEVDYLPDK